VKLEFSRQSNRKADEGSKHPDRNAQFEYINAKVIAAQAQQQPVISVDTKKKELIGNFKNGGTDYRPKGDPRRVNVHDFENKKLGKVVPYGVYDMTANAGFVSVGITSDTAEFAVQSIRRTEGVVDIKDLQLARLHRRAELIEQSRGEPRRLGLVRCILQTADGRLRGQRFTGLRTAADRELHQRVVPQPVEVDGILVPARDRQNTRHHHLEHRMPDAVRIAAIRHCFGEPQANTMLALRLPQKQWRRVDTRGNSRKHQFAM
jgi:hypothetical protein